MTKRAQRPQLVVPRPIAGKVPPSELEAESAVLSASLDVCGGPAGALDTVVSILKPDHFFSEQHQLIYEAMVHLHAQDKPVDPVTVMADLRARGLDKRAGGSGYLGSIIDATPAVANVEAHAQLVLDAARRRAIIGTCQLVEAEGYSDDVGDVQDWLSRVEERVFRATQQGHRTTVQPIRQLLPLAHRRMAPASGEEPQAVSRRFDTGLVAYDELVEGMFSGNLVVLAARPGMGKSALATDLAVLMARDIGDVAVFQLEMDKDETVERIIAQHAWVGLKKLRNPELLTDGDWRRITDTMRELDGLELHIDDTPQLTLAECRSKARKVAAGARAAGRRFAGVFVDYLQLMQWHGYAGSRDEVIGHLTRGLKALAKELCAPVVLLSQLNRGLESRSDKRPTLADLRESGNIEQDSDKVVFIYRESYYSGKANKRQAELICAKNRQGETGSTIVGWAPWCAHFHDEEVGYG